jgi:small conductance mechanosensitive channel
MTQTGNGQGPTELPAIVQAIADVLTSAGLPEALSGTIAQAIVFVAAFAVIYLVSRAVFTPLVGRSLGRSDLDAHARKPIQRITNIVLMFVAIAVAFAVAGYEGFLTSLATIAAAATLAIGFGLQEVIKNFVAGVFIYTDKPFRIGDWIEWDDYSGVVEDISLRVSRVRTFDNELLTVPNSTLTDGVIKNPVANNTLRLKFVFGIGYDDDIDFATDIIIDEAEKHPDILDQPAPSVRLTELADSYVGLQSRIWIANPSRADFVKTRAEYVKNVKVAFDEAGIDIPYPQRDLSGQIEMAGPLAVADAPSND